MEDSTGVCAKNNVGWIDWEYPDDNAQQSLGYYLDVWPNSGWISPAMRGSSNCGIHSSTAWKDTVSVYAYSTSGSADVYYS